jgi:hypothetical protein
VLPCRVDGCPNPGEDAFGLAIAPNDPEVPPSSAEGSVCRGHATELWALLGPRPRRVTEVLAEEFAAEMADPETTATVIQFDKRLAGL